MLTGRSSRKEDAGRRSTTSSFRHLIDPVSYGVYRSQFETGTSNGGLSAHPGGERWAWESRIFGWAYDEATPTLHPKYGALNHRFRSPTHKHATRSVLLRA